MVCVVFILLLCCLTQSLLGIAVPSILVSTDSGVHIYHGYNASVVTIHNNRPGCPAPCVNSLAYRFHSRDLFFISDGQIWLSFYSHQTARYVDAMPIMRDAAEASELVVDWVNYKLYFLNQSQRIFRSNLLGNDVIEVGSATNKLSLLTIDPYDKLLFYVEDGSLKHLCLQSFSVYGGEDVSGRGEITQLAVDHHSHILYFISVTRDPRGDSWSLEQVRYTRHDMFDHRVVFSKGMELQQATTLEVYGDTILWTRVSQYDELFLYVCNVYFCSSKYLVQQQLPFQFVTDLKLYNSLVQSAGVEYACTQLHCPDKCLETSLYTVQCVCPLGQTFDDLNNVCVENAIWTWEDSGIVEWIHTLKAWIYELTSRLDMLILYCCVLMLLTLECGLCLLPWTYTQQHAAQPTAEDVRRRCSLETITEV